MSLSSAGIGRRSCNVQFSDGNIPKSVVPLFIHSRRTQVNKSSPCTFAYVHAFVAGVGSVEACEDEASWYSDDAMGP